VNCVRVEPQPRQCPVIDTVAIGTTVKNKLTLKDDFSYCYSASLLVQYLKITAEII